MQKLVYQTPPKEWMEGLPIGNGRLAAMVWGDDKDRLTLNHEWLWTGRNKGRKVRQSAEGLPLVREAIRNGEHFTATALANSFFGGKGGISGIPGQVDDYQPAGELTFQLAGESGFVRRELDIRTGLAKVCRKSGEALVKGEFFCRLHGPVPVRPVGKRDALFRRAFHQPGSGGGHGGFHYRKGKPAPAGWEHFRRHPVRGPGQGLH